MSLGTLRHKIAVEQLSDVSDGMGGFTRSWNTFLNSSAEIRPMSGSERYFAGKLEGDTTHKIRMRYRQGITAQMRVKFTGDGTTRYFQIRGILTEDEHRAWTILMCAEGPAT